MLLSEFAEIFDHQVLPLKKPSSADTMRSHLRTILPALGGVELTDISYPIVQEFITALSGRLSPKMTRNIWGTLSNLLRRAEKQGLITRVPRPDLPGLAYEEQDWLSVEQMRTLIAAAEPPYDLLFSILAETGVRISESLGIQVGDIDLKKRTLNIQRQIYHGKVSTLKTRNAYRRIAISRRLADLLRRSHRRDPQQLLFATRVETPWSPGKALAAIREACRTVSIPAVGAHAFRRGNATLMGSVLEIHPKIMAYRLGHGLQDITLGLYTKPLPDFDRSAAEQLGDLLFKSTK